VNTYAEIIRTRVDDPKGGAALRGAQLELVARYRRAGMVVFGTTNTPEFGLSCTTEPVLHRPTRNPWRTTHSSGGSSGGSAPAVCLACYNHSSRL